MKNRQFESSMLWQVSIILALFFGFPSASLAQQMSIAEIQITGVNTTSFPEIFVTALVRDGNNQPVPVEDISANIEILENNKPVDYEHKMVEVGIEAIFVFDIGGALTYDEGRSDARLAEMKQIVTDYIVSMGPNDTSGVIVVTPSEMSYLQPLTSDQNLLAKKISELTIEDTKAERSRGLDGVLEGLAELSTSNKRGKVVQTILLLSSGIQEGKQSSRSVIDQAVTNGVFIHSLLVRDGINTEILEEIATGSHGVFASMNSLASVQKIFDWISTQNMQHSFNFRSSQNLSSERTVILRNRISGTGHVASKANFIVNVEAPVVIIESPANNQEIVRKAPAYDSDLDQVELTEQPIVVHIDWPDGYPRAITEAQLWIDSTRYGSSIAFPGDKFMFSWDLRPYRQAGTTGVKIRAQVKDELGLENISPQVDVNISVIIPASPLPFDVDYCLGQQGLDLIKCRITILGKQIFATPSGLISLGSFIIALIAGLFAYRYRGRISQAGGHVISAIRETIVRFNRPGDAEISAYLEVLRGDEMLIGKQIPLYINTDTPVGRNPQVAELVFDMTNELSVVSRRHCAFCDEDGIIRIRDLGSTHGTYVNGIRLPEGGDGQVLADGDRIEIGPVERGGILLLFKSTNNTHAASYKYRELNKSNPAHLEDDIDAEELEDT